MSSSTLTALRRLLDPPSRDGSVDEAASVLTSLRGSELARLVDSSGAEPVALARGHAVALDGGSVTRVIEAIRAVLPGVPRATTIELSRVSIAGARSRRALGALVGASDSLDRVRRAAFVACFGPSLAHARRLMRVIRDHDVLVTGETGTGKEHVAEAILAGSLGDANGTAAPRGEINIAAIPETLLESELFGHRKGAFTGATAERVGVVRSSDGGCLFLDEVGELPFHVQVKLLRVLETDRVQPLGSDRYHQVDVRFIGATHRDLPALIAEGRFRHDLYQRLSGTVIDIPPLRERPDDVAAIGDRFLAELASESELGDEVRAARRWLRGPVAKTHRFPGNVRELKNILRNLLLGLPLGVGDVASGGVGKDREDFPEALREGRLSLAEVERWYLERTIERVDGNLAAAARILGVDRTTVARRLRASL